MRQPKTAETILFSILFLFFLQSLSDFIQSIYAFGLLVTAFTVQIAAIVLLFTPLLLLFLRQAPSRRVMLGLAYIALLARLFEPLLEPGGRLVTCGISVGAFMLLFPLLLHRSARASAWSVTGGLVIALSLSIFLRTANSSLDLSESGPFQAISWLLAILAGMLIWRTDFPVREARPATPTTARRVTGLSIGIASVFLMAYFAFASPSVLARWTGASYPAIIAVLVAAFAAFSLLLGSERFIERLTPRLVLGWNLAFVVMLVLTILPYQMVFPANPALYPLDARAVPAEAGIFLFLMLLLSPVLFIDFLLFTRQISSEAPSLRQLGGGFALAALFFLVMVFFQVFTTIYDYAPVVGPLFRDRFWLVYLLAGLGLGLPVLLVRRETYPAGRIEYDTSLTAVSVAVLAVLSVAALFLTGARPEPRAGTGQLKVMTYNLQQGFDAIGNANVDGQLAVIEKVAPDILGIQESDTARIANGNIDTVRYMADHLNMYSYYGPTTTTGTFGIALLSKYPIQKPTTFFMYSKGEQTATIHAEIVVSGKTYHVFVTHLGNGGPRVQLENMLARMQGLENVIAMGDFNFGPSTDQYALATGSLADAWLLRWPGGKEIAGVALDDRIDQMFVSPGTMVIQSEYVSDPASDHPYLYSVIQP